MTLCIAWKINNSIHFASDSRAKLTNNSHFDHCIKVVSVPIKILGPIGIGDSQPDILYEQNIGMCYAGSFMNAYTLKEIMAQTLSKLQSIPGITDVSMEQLCRLISKFYEFISKKVSYALFEKGLAKFFLTGYCPKDKRIKAFKFEVNVDEDNNELTASFEEILRNNNEIEFIGSGSGGARRRYKNITNTNPLSILRDIIKDANINSVGGSIQYGKIDAIDFKVYGIQDYSVDENRKEIEISYNINGVEILDNPFTIKWDEFHLMQTYITPFKVEIDSYIEQNYLVVT
jgi:hypothetical protein